MSDGLHGELTVHGHTLHYARTGGDHPPLLMVHGFTDSGACWTRLATSLSADFDVIMPDAYGHGNSSRVIERVTLGHLADHLVTVIQTLGLVEVLAVGHSMGAATVALAAASQPNLFRAIVLEDPPWRSAPPPPEITQQGTRLWYEWLVGLRQRPTAEAISETQASQPAWAAIDVETYVTARKQVDITLFEQMDWELTQHWRETVRQIRCPLLLLTADPALEAIVTPAVAQEVLALARYGEIAYFSGAGHHINRQRFDEYLAVLRPFLLSYATD